MPRIFYETLGRVTWAVGKRKARQALTPKRSRKSLIVATVVVAAGALAGGAILARAHAPST